MFISPNELIKHIETIHEGLHRLACAHCNKPSTKLHGAQVHYGICKVRKAGEKAANPIMLDEPSVPNSEHEFKCESCKASFKSNIGLGQHIRHRHPDVANTRQVQAIQKDIERKRQARSKASEQQEASADTESTKPRKKGTKSKVFSEEEDELIRKWSTADSWTTGPELAKLMTNKTDVQIRSRRRALNLLKGKVFAAVSKKARDSSVAKPSTAPVKRVTNELRRDQFAEAMQTQGSERFVGTSGELLARAAAGENVDDEMTNLIALLKAENDESRSTRRTGRPKSKRQRRKKGKKRGNARDKKREEYSLQQSLFEKDQKSLARLILDCKGTDEKCNISPEIVQETYMERFGDVSQEVDLSEYPTPEPVDKGVLIEPISVSPEEVQKAFRRANKNTSPGPDQIDLKFVIKVNPDGKFLANVFNTWLCSGKVPASVKENRSILLPKGSEGLDNINNWRPLTISSVLLRLYTSILAKRVLKSFNLNERQRGFIDAPGCAENTYLIQQIIEDAKKNRNELCVTFLDLAKAFDTVSHKHLVAGLERFGVDQHFIDIVSDLYRDVSTVFKTEQGETGRIPMTRGVKQGDPLSPLLFNIAMYSLLCKISEQCDGYKFGPEKSDKIEALAYADDNALTTGFPADMHNNCGLVQTFCMDTGMRLNVKKSAAFYVKPGSKNSWLVNQYPTAPTIGGEEIPLIDPEDCTKYLGSTINPCTTIRRKNLEDQCEVMLKRIGKSKLKPRQKLHMLKQYALPRMTFPLTMNEYSKTSLQKLDGMIRCHVQEWLKLPMSAPNPLLYSKQAAGVIGLPQLERSVPAMRINALRSVLFSNDSKIQRIAEVMETQLKIDKLGKAIGIKIPNREKGKATWHKLVENDWEKLACARKGRGATKQAEANSWLGKQYFSEADYITALQLRGDTYPCRVTLARGKRNADVRCRRCGQTYETVGHISGACSKVKDYRIRRHNMIVNCLAEKCKSAGWTVSFEPKLSVNNQVLKPDLVLVWRN